MSIGGWRGPTARCGAGRVCPRKPSGRKLRAAQMDDLIPGAKGLAVSKPITTAIPTLPRIALGKRPKWAVMKAARVPMVCMIWRGVRLSGGEYGEDHIRTREEGGG